MTRGDYYGYHTPGDPHGYHLLFDKLRAIVQKLHEQGLPAIADRLNWAVGFYGGGSPTEFLGESMLALECIINSDCLSSELTSEINSLLSQLSKALE